MLFVLKRPHKPAPVFSDPAYLLSYSLFFYTFKLRLYPTPLHFHFWISLALASSVFIASLVFFHMPLGDQKTVYVIELPTSHNSSLSASHSLLTSIHYK